MEPASVVIKSSKDKVEGVVARRLDVAIDAVHSVVNKVLPEDMGTLFPSARSRSLLRIIILLDIDSGETSETGADTVSAKIAKARKLGSTVQSRLHKKAIGKWQAWHGRNVVTVQRLQQCVEMMRTSQTQIEVQIASLRDSLALWQALLEQKYAIVNDQVRKQKEETLAAINQKIAVIRADVTETVRHVVDVVGRQATSLPTRGQQLIKDNILALPRRCVCVF